MTKEDLETAEILIPEIPKFYTWPMGCAICVVELFDCVPSSRYHDPQPLLLTQQEVALGDYTIGRWVWRTQNLHPLKEPVPILGRQGLWIPDPDTVNKIQSIL